MVNVLSIIIGILVVVILIMRESHKIRIAELNRDIRYLRRIISNRNDEISTLSNELDTARNCIVKRNQEIFKMIEGYKNDIHKG